MEASDLRVIDEKKLREFITIVRNFVKHSDLKVVTQFEYTIALRFSVSEFLSKEYDGLLRINSNKTFSTQLITDIKKYKVVEHILDNMHHDLVHNFVEMLCKLWTSNEYDSTVLEKFWNLSITQHSQEIGKFFDEWPKLINTIPKNKINDFWEIVKNSNSYPLPVLKLLEKINNKCDKETMEEISIKLWDSAIDSKDKVNYVTTIIAYTSQESINELINKCFDLIKQKKENDSKFSLLILSKIWKSFNDENTRKQFDILLKKCKISNDDINILFELLIKISDSITPPLTEKELISIRNLIEPLFGINNELISTFYDKMISIKKGKLFPKEELEYIIQWLSEKPNIDSMLFKFITNLFYKINNINNETILNNLDLIGFNSIWNLMLTTNLTEIPIFIVDLLTRCDNSEATKQFIEKCIPKIETFGVLNLLILLISKVEDSLDLNKYGISRNLYIPENSYIHINLQGDYNERIKVVYNITVPIFKTYVSRKCNIEESKLDLLIKGEKLNEKHRFVDDETITIYIKMFASPPRKLKKEELPSQIIKNSDAYKKLFKMIKVEPDQTHLPEYALNLLNYMETAEAEKFESNSEWSKLLTLKKPYLLVYRLNYLAKLITTQPVSFIKTFCKKKGYKQLLVILENINYEMFHNKSYYDLIFSIISMIIGKTPQEIKNKTYEQINTKKLIKSLIKHIIEINNKDQSYVINSLLLLINDITKMDENIILSQKLFQEFLEKLLFSNVLTIRIGISRILLLINPKKIENIIIENIEKATKGNCYEYFNLLNYIIKTYEDPLNLYNSLMKFLMKNFIIYKNNSKLNYNEEEDYEELQESVNELCGDLVDSTFLTGIINVLILLLEKINEKQIKHIKKHTLYIMKHIAFNLNRYISPPTTIYTLLNILLNKEPKLIKDIIPILNELHKNTNFNMKQNMMTTLTSIKTIKGIQNMGFTCYLNSSLQQIFRIENIRNSVLSYKPSKDIDIEYNWLTQLQLLFAKLLYLPVNAIDASPFVSNMKSWDGKPINPHEQQDAVEFIQNLLDRIDESLESKPVTESVKGIILHKVCGVGVDFESNSEELFSTFPLEINGKKNLDESYKAVLIPDTFTNYKANEDLGYIDVNSYSTIKKAPTNLIFQLKRFDFDLATLQRKKINSFYEFTFETDISIMLTDNSKPLIYELCGIVMHSGTANGGHYFSYVKDEITNEWICCNDSNVSKLNIKNIIKDSVGGIINTNEYDKNKKVWIQKQKENSQSAYLLIYKQKDRKLPNNDIEPITLMPSIMLKEFLNYQKTLILNQLINDNYISFVEQITKTSKDKIIYQFLFDFIFKLFSSNNFTLIDSTFEFVIKKIRNDKKFAKFIISQHKKIIKTLIGGIDISTRTNCLRIVIPTLEKLGKKSKDFIEQILQDKKKILGYYNKFDQIFIPIYIYITKIDYNRNDILEWMFTFLDELLEVIPNDKLEETLSKINLSYLFKSILYLIDKLNIGDKYKDKIFEPEFINHWFISPAHSFDFASLMTYFMKDNEELTNNYYNYLIKTKEKKSILMLAANFANILTFKDNYSIARVNWFFTNMIEDNEGYNLTQLIKYTTTNLRSKKSEFSCEIALATNELWFKQWIFNNDGTIRSATEDFIYSLFPNYPKLNQNSSLPKDKTFNDTKEEKEQIKVLFNLLMTSNKKMVSQCKAASSILINKKAFDIHLSVDTYFNLLSFCVFYGNFQNEIIKNKNIFVNNINEFSKLKNNLKSGITNELKFFNLFKFKDFFDDKTISVFLNALRKAPSDNLVQYNVFVTSTFFSIIKDINITENNSKIISKSALLKVAIENISADIDKDLSNLIMKITKYSVGNIISLYSKKIFNNLLLTKATNYYELIIKLFKCNKVYLETFKSQCLSILIEAIKRQFKPNEQNSFVNDYVYILSQFIEIYLNYYKNKNSKFSKPIQSLFDYWKNDFEFFVNLNNFIFKSIANPNLTSNLISILMNVLTFDKTFAQKLNLILENKSEDIYLKVNNENKAKYAKFILMISAFIMNQNELFDVILQDLNNINEYKIVDGDLINVYVNEIKNISDKVKTNEKKVVKLLKTFYENTNELIGFKASKEIVDMFKSNEEFYDFVTKKFKEIADNYLNAIAINNEMTYGAEKELLKNLEIIKENAEEFDAKFDVETKKIDEWIQLFESSKFKYKDDILNLLKFVKERLA